MNLGSIPLWLASLALAGCACRRAPSCVPADPGPEPAGSSAHCVSGLPFQVSFYTGGSVMLSFFADDVVAAAKLNELERKFVGIWTYNTDIRFPSKSLALRTNHEFEFTIVLRGAVRRSRGTWKVTPYFLFLEHVAVDGRPLCDPIETVHFLDELDVRSGTGELPK